MEQVCHSLNVFQEGLNVFQEGHNVFQEGHNVFKKDLAPQPAELD